MKDTRQGSIRFLSFLAAAAATVLVVGASPTLASDGGNSDAAHLCQGGWKQYAQTDQTPFKNAGECISYAGQGGTLTPKSAAGLLCESAGGTFAPGSENVFWYCTYVWSPSTQAALAEQCFRDVAAWALKTAAPHQGHVATLTNVPGVVEGEYTATCTGELFG